MFKEMKYTEILVEYKNLQKTAEENKDKPTLPYIKGIIHGIEMCMNKFGYEFTLNNGDWSIDRIDN